MPARNIVSNLDIIRKKDVIAMCRLLVFSLLFFPFANCFCQELYFDEAGRYYNISPELLEAIAWVESNKTVNAVNNNKNGSYDFCHMQINSKYWKPVLENNWQYLSNPRYCSMVGAWVLRQCVDRYGYNWDAVACYHTGYSPKDAPNKGKKERGIKYIKKVQNALKER